MPVGHDQAIEVPLTAEEVAQQCWVGTARHAVDVVVRGHHADRAGTDPGLGRRQMDLPKIARADHGGLAVAATDRLALSSEVLENDADAWTSQSLPLRTLHPADQRGRHLRDQQRGLAQTLLGPAPARVTQHV